ncbi:MAG: alpha/beta hydrolase fold domain-containing protein, partial [Christensenellaceae bacterium]
MLSAEARRLIFESKRAYEADGGKDFRSVEEVRREEYLSSLALASVYAHTDVTTENWDGVFVDVMCAKERKRDDVLFFIHGGAWAFGSAMNARLTACYFTEEAKGRAVCVDYRRAPEFKFSVLLDDCYRAYLEAASRYGAKNLVLSGSSAGGNLALALMQRLKEEGLAYPKAILLSSPVTLIDPEKDSNALTKYDIVLRGCGYDDRAVAAYADNPGEERGKYFSPLLGEYDGFPPMYIACGSEERLLDDSVLLFKKAKKSGVKAVLSVRAGMWHAYLECQYFIPEAKE